MVYFHSDEKVGGILGDETIENIGQLSRQTTGDSRMRLSLGLSPGVCIA